ncbi:MAG: ABC transporter permease [Candidatus Methanomethyliaceae archaeon]
MSLLWECCVRLFEVPHWLLPSPTSIAKEGWKWRNVLLLHTGVTLYEVSLGFFLAATAGGVLAVLITWGGLLKRLLYPLIIVMQSVPKVALAPLFLVWVGYGLASKILIVFLVSFFPIVVDTITGLQEVEPEALDLVRLLNARKVQIFLKIRLPNSLPYMFSGLKVGITLAVVGAVIGEFVGSDRGLGYLLLSAAGMMNIRLMFVCILILASLGIALFYAIECLERLLIPWTRSRR